MKMDLEPKIAPLPLWLGTGVHEALACYYLLAYDLRSAEALVNFFDLYCEKTLAKYESDLGTLWDEEKELYLQNRALGEDILRNYHFWAKPLDEAISVIDTEVKFRTPVPDFKNVFYEGTIDGYGEDDEGYLILEHKTARTIETDKLILDDQCGSYLWGASKFLDVPFKKVLYNIMRKKAPRVPAPLSKGGLSVNKSIDTTYEVYEQALKDYYQTPFYPEGYEGILSHLQLKGNTFYKRESVRRSETELELLEQRIVAEISDMISPDLRIYPSASRDCSYCSFRSPCIAWCDGSDHKFILEQNFVPRKAVKV